MARENPLDPSLRPVFSTKGGEFLPYERDGKSIPTMSWFPLSADAELGHGGRYLCASILGAKDRSTNIAAMTNSSSWRGVSSTATAPCSRPGTTSCMTGLDPLHRHT